MRTKLQARFLPHFIRSLWSLSQRVGTLKQLACAWLAVIVASADLVCSADEPSPAYADKLNLMVVIGADGVKRQVKTAEDWRVRRQHILKRFQLVMGKLPDAGRKCPIEPQVVEQVELEKVTRKKILYTVETGDRASAFLLLPKGQRGRAPAMLCLHQTVTWGKDDVVGVNAKYPDQRYALELAERGYVTLAPDAPGHGERRTCNPSALGYDSHAMKGIWDHMRAVDLLQSLAEVDPERIGVIGHSMGGCEAIFVAMFDPRIEVVVQSCGYGSHSAYAKTWGDLSRWSSFGTAGALTTPRISSVYHNDPAQMPFDFPELIAALAPRPFFSNSPLHDEIFEKSGTDDCIKAARPVYELFQAADKLAVVNSDCGHGFPETVRKRAYEFLEQSLQRKP